MPRGAPGRAVMKVSVQGLDRIAHKLRPDVLIDPARREMTDDLARLAEGQAEKRAPRRSGRLAGSVRRELRAGTWGPYAIIRADATRRGFPYGYALNASSRYHYAATGRRRVRTTKGWFSKVPSIVRAQLRGILRKAEALIERTWEK